MTENKERKSIADNTASKPHSVSSRPRFSFESVQRHAPAQKKKGHRSESSGRNLLELSRLAYGRFKALSEIVLLIVVRHVKFVADATVVAHCSVVQVVLEFC